MRLLQRALFFSAPLLHPRRRRLRASALSSAPSGQDGVQRRTSGSRAAVVKAGGREDAPGGGSSSNVLPDCFCMSPSLVCSFLPLS